jgi:hypothetical protein
MARIKTPHFSADWTNSGAELAISLRGNADMAVQDEVKGFLEKLHEAARTARAREAVFDVTELYFMNSSCLSLFLRFINGIMELPASERYRIRFRSNPNLRWQRKSLAALRAYAQDVVGVE